MFSAFAFAAAVVAPPPAKIAALEAPAVLPQPARLYTSQPVTVGVCEGGALTKTAKVQSPDALRLGDLPKANLERTVMVRQGGCVKPQIVRYGTGR